MEMELKSSESDVAGRLVGLVGGLSDVMKEVNE